MDALRTPDDRFAELESWPYEPRYVKIAPFLECLTPGEAAAYDAPFPDESSRAGARQFPVLVPIGNADAPTAAMLRDAWSGLERFDRPFVTAFAEHEDVTRLFEPILQQRIPGAAGRHHSTVRGAGHFLQEQAPDELVEIVLSLT